MLVVKINEEWTLIHCACVGNKAAIFSLRVIGIKKASLLGVRFYRHRNVYPMLKDMNKRREQIALDQKLRHGKEERQRRSEFPEW